MTKIARYGRTQAKPGQGATLAGLLLRVAESLRATPGCELYLINQAADDPDTVWITEQWTDKAAMDAALAAAHEGSEGDDAPPTPAEVMELVVPGQWQMTELTPLGGVGGVGGTDIPDGYTQVNLGAVEDVAPKFGFGEIGEARFANDDLGVGPTGISFHALHPGRRQSFGHRHDSVEEIYVVVSGRGRMKVGDDVVDLEPLDAVRVGPRVPRALEARDEGVQVIAFGQRRKGDGEILPGWWTD